jgi:mannose-6-phosphate isomerase-like protein (cupin superfamily)
MFEHRRLGGDRDAVAPDGSDVRLLLGLGRGSMAHFSLAPGGVSVPVYHRTVEEIWYVVAGWGEMWRRHGDREEVLGLEAGMCLTIPLGTHFQFRTIGGATLEAVGITMPPWPGDGEAIRSVHQKWQPTAVAGPGLHEQS